LNVIQTFKVIDYGSFDFNSQRTISTSCPL